MLVSGQAWASVTEATCKTLIPQKKYIALADCFAKLASAAGNTKTLPLKARYKKGQYLRNASVALLRAAAQHPKQAMALRLRAIAILKEYSHKQQLCLDKERCRWATKRIQKLQNSLGVTTIHIVTNDKNAQITLRSGKRILHGKGNWSPSVIPGVYNLVVAYPDQEPQLKRLLIEQGKTKRYTFTPTPKAKTATRPEARQPTTARPPSRSTKSARQNAQPNAASRFDAARYAAQRKRRVGIYIGYIGGGLALGLSAIGMAAGYVVWDKARDEWKLPDTPQSKEEELQKQSEGGVALIATAWLGLIVGAGLGVMGLVFHIQYKNHSKPLPKQPDSVIGPPDDTGAFILLQTFRGTL